MARRPYLVDSANEISIGDPLDPQGSGGLYDQGSGEYVDDAVVTLEDMIDEDTGADVSGTLVLPIALDYVDGSKGVYAVTLPTGADVEVGQRIVAHVEVVEGAQLSRVFAVRMYGEAG